MVYRLFIQLLMQQGPRVAKSATEAYKRVIDCKWDIVALIGNEFRGEKKRKYWRGRRGWL